MHLLSSLFFTKQVVHKYLQYPIFILIPIFCRIQLILWQTIRPFLLLLFYFITFCLLTITTLCWITIIICWIIIIVIILTVLISLQICIFITFNFLFLWIYNITLIIFHIYISSIYFCTILPISLQQSSVMTLILPY